MRYAVTYNNFFSNLLTVNRCWYKIACDQEKLNFKTEYYRFRFVCL